jgi:hypothetical protein
MSMAEIIPMKDAGRRFSQARSPSVYDRTVKDAEILFFTGVRYERRKDDDKHNSASPKGKGGLGSKSGKAARS